jgi:hypothetical protein
LPPFFSGPFILERGSLKMNFLLENKWVILISLEVLAWLSTFFVLYARYKLKSSFWFKVATVLFALTGVIPQVLMGIINFISAKKVDLFTLIIILLILYGFTIGKKHVKKLDAWAQKKFSRQTT